MNAEPCNAKTGSLSGLHEGPQEPGNDAEPTVSSNDKLQSLTLQIINEQCINQDMGEGVDADKTH